MGEGVGEVIVIDQHQIPGLGTHQCGHLSALAGDIQLSASSALQAHAIGGFLEEVHADCHAVRAGFPSARLRASLRDGKAGVDAVFRDLEFRGQRIDAGGLEPLRSPIGKIASAGLLQCLKQVRKRGIAPCMSREVRANSGEECLDAHVFRELLEHAGTLGVGDAIEVGIHGHNVRSIAEHRVGGGELILPISPRLFLVREGHPCGGVLRGTRLAHGCGPRGEGLIEPQVIPPLHGHQVAEPHVGKLMQDGVRAAFVLVVAGCGTEDVLIPDGYAAGIFHGTHVVFGAEDLVVLVERVTHPEVLGVVIKALFGDLEEFICVQVLCQRLAAVKGKRHAHLTLGDQLTPLARSFSGFRRRLRVRSHAARPLIADHVPGAHTESD